MVIYIKNGSDVSKGSEKSKLIIKIVELIHPGAMQPDTEEKMTTFERERYKLGQKRLVAATDFRQPTTKPNLFDNYIVTIIEKLNKKSIENLKEILIEEQEKRSVPLQPIDLGKGEPVTPAGSVTNKAEPHGHSELKKPRNQKFKTFTPRGAHGRCMKAIGEEYAQNGKLISKDDMLYELKIRMGATLKYGKDDVVFHYTLERGKDSKTIKIRNSNFENMLVKVRKYVKEIYPHCK